MRAAVRADLPVRVERPVAARADVAHLGVANRAHHEVLLDGAAAMRAGAVLGKLALAQSHVELLLLAVGEVGVRPQDVVCDKAHKGQKGKQAPCPEVLGPAAARIDEHVYHREDIQRDDERDEEVDDEHHLRRHELLDVLHHTRSNLSVENPSNINRVFRQNRQTLYTVMANLPKKTQQRRGRRSRRSTSGGAQ